ncbi:hypothetical protein DSECCO2_583390 [anaerobic digester metagenome]
MHRFPLPVIINARPGSHGPYIIQLPVERAHAKRHIRPVGSECHAYGICLQQLTNVEQMFKVFGNLIILFHILPDAEVADAAALVRSHYRGFNIPVFRQGVLFHAVKFGE